MKIYRRFFLLPALAWIFAAGFCGQGQGIGLSTKFIRVIADNVPMGKRIYLSGVGLPKYSVTNLGKKSALIDVRVIAPQPEDCKAGYEPLPDPSWIEMEESQFNLAPAAVKHLEVFISIPRDHGHENKKYHAKITATIVNNSSLVSTALSSHLFIHTSPRTRAK